MGNDKAWYASKTKWAGLLGGLTIALPGVISWLSGTGFDYTTILTGITAILAVFGIRDLPILNAVKK